MINGLVPNYVNDRFAIKTYLSVRGDRLCRVPAISCASTARVRNKVENSLAILGPKLFNSIPAELRNFEGSFQAFKTRLDKLLQRVWDKPCLPDYYQCASSNSLITQFAQMRAAGIYF